MIENVPTIMNQPTIYNGGGGGAPGDFGPGGGVVPSGPTGYRQVAGVYIIDNVGVGGYNAYKRYDLNNVFGISKTDFTGCRFVGKFFFPSNVNIDRYISIFLFNLENDISPYKRFNINLQSFQYVSEKISVRCYCSNGSGAGNLYPIIITPGVDVANLFESSCTIGDSSAVCTYSPPVTQSKPVVYPFVGDGKSYKTDSFNIAVVDSKLYTQDGDLMLHFVPVVRNSDSMPGLYEIVHDVFCDNPYCNVIEKIEE